MGQILHGSARTTEAVRRAIQHSQESLRALAKRVTKKRTTATKESWTATIWTLGSIRRTCQAAMARCGDQADD